MSFRTTIPIAFALLAALVLPASAGADETGGMAAGQGPSIASVRCVATPAAPCAQDEAATMGGQVQIVGRDLDAVRTVTFRGGRGRRDDVTVRARHVRPTHVEALVPSRARSGRIEVRARRADRAVTTSAVRVVRPAPATTAAPAGSGEGVFPIRGKHDLGQTATNNFGGGRNHKGQDLFAACGTPMAVAESGTVVMAKFQSSAGNYAVIRSAKTGRDAVYMHMRAPALVSKGDAVTAGQPLGEVGDSGNANGCHLHFELWSAPGWYEGGTAVDPLPDLRAWDARDGAHKH